MGGRGAGSGLGLSDGPRGGNNKGDIQWIQPDTPQMRPPAPTIKGQIGDKGAAISPTEAATSVNPFRNPEYGDYSMNCQRCVVAYELNRRGYKVEAEASYDRDPYPQGNHWMSAFKGGKMVDVGATTTNAVNNKILSNMKTWGNGSRGIVAVDYGGGEGHVFNVEYRGGKLQYYDGQTGERYNPKTVFDHVKRRNVQVMRSDNLELSDNVRDMVRKR